MKTIRIDEMDYPLTPLTPDEIIRGKHLVARYQATGQTISDLARNPEYGKQANELMLDIVLASTLRGTPACSVTLNDLRSEFSRSEIERMFLDIAALSIPTPELSN